MDFRVDDEVAERVRLVSSQFAKSAVRIGVAMSQVAGGFALAMMCTARWWEEAGERAYRQEFGRLPGSNRTARLRKKRRKAVDALVRTWLREQ